jgi:lipopolysaccharide transport protein LptA
VRANGTRATLDLDAGRGELFGSPVQASSPRGRMTAPRVLYNTEHQIMNAIGGVRAVLEQTGDTNLAGSPLGEGEGPVWVESREAFWRQAPSSFLFRGDVRAWRGENLMLTSELRGDKEEDKLTATGGVKTLWVPAKETAGTAPAKASAKGETTASRAPVEVTAQELVYREAAGVLVYTGNVRVVQEGKTLQGQRLEVQMNEDKEAKVMTCTGDVKVDDPKAGRHIEGQKAVYDLALRRMEITGDKVSMRDREGNRVQGRRVLYFVDDGKVEVKGKDDTAAPVGTAPGRG